MPITNTTTVETASKPVNVVGIAVGICVPLTLAIAAGIGYLLWKRNQRLKDEKQLADERRKKAEEGAGETKRKKATEFEKTQAEKRMENEILQQIKDLETESAFIPVPPSQKPSVPIVKKEEGPQPPSRSMAQQNDIVSVQQIQRVEDV